MCDIESVFVKTLTAECLACYCIQVGADLLRRTNKGYTD